ncbi:MAG: acylphosphatase [Candidatus Ancaeobacter aquaticus]|nr:acylphosphatase [Candidatus Ancaeobacter aquaticus]
MAENKRVSALFHGVVQGVGFRFTVVRISYDYNIKGFVKNLLDGSVEVVAEGNMEILEQFLHKIKTGELERYIRSSDIEYFPATGKYRSFGVEY